MRKPRDYDSELKALEDKARELKTRKVQQLGELVIATGADALSTDELAGALVALPEKKETAKTAKTAKREAWAKREAAFFQGRARHDMRTWQSERRKRTKHLIELGGLVIKSGVVDLTGDDRATMFGALIWIAHKLKSERREQACALWAGKGKKAFELEGGDTREVATTTPTVSR